MSEPFELGFLVHAAERKLLGVSEYRFSPRRWPATISFALVVATGHLAFLSAMVATPVSNSKHSSSRDHLTSAQIISDGEFASTVFFIRSDERNDLVDALSKVASRGIKAFEEMASVTGPTITIASIADGNLTDSAIDASATRARTELYEHYVDQVAARINRAWERPASIPTGNEFSCEAHIEQSSSGRVKSVELAQCTEDVTWQLSLVHAIEAASPLSSPPSPDAFSERLVLSFRGHESR